MENNDTFLIGAQIEGFFYDDNLGPVWAGVSIGESKDGVSAWWYVNSGNGGYGNSLPVKLVPGITYPVEISYDEENNEFTFTVNGVSQSYTGSPKIGPSSINFKSLTTGIWGNANLARGSASALFDNITINHESSTYDDFESNLLSPFLWDNLEQVREIRDRELHLSLHVDDSNKKHELSIVPSNGSDFFEADISVGSGSFFIEGAIGAASLGGFFYNDSRGPGSGLVYNGYEGDVWSQISLKMNDSSNLVAVADILRSNNAEATSFTSLYSYEFAQLVNLNTDYTLSVQLNEHDIIFTCNEETTSYPIANSFYEPSEKKRSLVSRIFAQGGAGFLDATFDNVATVREPTCPFYFDKDNDADVDGKDMAIIILNGEYLNTDGFLNQFATSFGAIAN